MKKFMFMLLTLVFIAACASPYAPQAKALKAAYERGEISAAEFHNAVIRLEALDLQRRQNMAFALQQAGQHLGNIDKRYPAYQGYTSGVIYGPNGQNYQYYQQSY